VDGGKLLTADKRTGRVAVTVALYLCAEPSDKKIKTPRKGRTILTDGASRRSNVSELGLHHERGITLQWCNRASIYRLALTEQIWERLSLCLPETFQCLVIQHSSQFPTHSLSSHCKAVELLEVLYVILTTTVDPTLREEGKEIWRADPMTGCLSLSSFYALMSVNQLKAPEIAKRTGNETTTSGEASRRWTPSMIRSAVSRLYTTMRCKALTK
jgi:hypothetical protein